MGSKGVLTSLAFLGRGSNIAGVPKSRLQVRNSAQALAVASIQHRCTRGADGYARLASLLTVSESIGALLSMVRAIGHRQMPPPPPPPPPSRLTEETVGVQ